MKTPDKNPQPPLEPEYAGIMAIKAIKSKIITANSSKRKPIPLNLNIIFISPRNTISKIRFAMKKLNFDSPILIIKNTILYLNISILK